MNISKIFINKILSKKNIKFNKINIIYTKIIIKYVIKQI